MIVIYELACVTPDFFFFKFFEYTISLMEHLKHSQWIAAAEKEGLKVIRLGDAQSMEPESSAIEEEKVLSGR